MIVSTIKEYERRCLPLTLRSSAIGRWSWPVAGEPDRPNSPRTWESASPVCVAWMDQADVEDCHKEGLTRDERAELVRLRREKRVPEIEVEILKRASTSAYFARENILPK
jgi:hypothetical protein